MPSSTSARSPQLSASSPRPKQNGLFPPLSNHGLPKTPMPLSPDGSLRPHRFSGVRAPSPLPGSPPPMSPPMSAKSFGTFIDSEPSTPAYSPRMGSTWDGSTIVLLSPRSSAPSSPTEPTWDMLSPMKRPKRMTFRKKSAPAPVKEITTSTSLSSHPLTPALTPAPKESQKENFPPAQEDPAPQAEEEEPAHTAALEKLATKVKSMLRRKSSGSSDKKIEEKKRRRGYTDLDRIEDVHWTEM
ncbi:hypothetical protein BU26DRAFT_45673 [Trematosphaeria pertusa]|uniref:Uncharacterized protein n=1 Tax=Trematosphaeria pertusa TaxID=390896 RepID=A0A6A6I7B5_9PLEO|nr:uncharacterized protein BU26DRAFT_45673 [Trematosphaeria pertusa]KAF2246444.1 hypothetical protein BU26DRAFT_45673 [Trematosphaeria pertusa]